MVVAVAAAALVAAAAEVVVVVVVVVVFVLNTDVKNLNRHCIPMMRYGGIYVISIVANFMQHTGWKLSTKINHVFVDVKSFYAGEKLTYTNWFGGGFADSFHGFEDCILLTGARHGHMGRWADVQCHGNIFRPPARYHWICQYSKST